MATIRERGKGVWEIRVFTGRDAKGRPMQVSRTVRGSKRDAQRVAAELTIKPSPRATNRSTRATNGTNLYLGDAVTARETHAREPAQPETVHRLTASLRRTMREPLAIDQGPTGLQPIAALRAERDQLRRQLGPRPIDHSRRLAWLEHEIRLVRETHPQALARLDFLEHELEGVGRISRRLHPERPRDITQRLEHTGGVAEHCTQELERLAVEHRKLTVEQRALQRWEHVHAPELR